MTAQPPNGESNSWFHKITPGNWLTLAVLIIGGAATWGEFKTTIAEIERRVEKVEPVVVEQAKLKVEIAHLTKDLQTTRDLLNQVLTQLRTYHTPGRQR